MLLPGPIKMLQKPKRNRWQFMMSTITTIQYGLAGMIGPTGAGPNQSPNEHIGSCQIQMSPSRSQPTGTPCQVVVLPVHTQ
ncbi:hypothetical protein AMELA_G00009040 [Ameiurus melas]|uniref:Uncharacterized protein n=1 Tax=Ameiurus melas TaxID=219545 RepID=A0A7J6BHF5_AMEME|nr:hypothetical protein AMELA_G00009040 [Ameiurus melas]